MYPDRCDFVSVDHRPFGVEVDQLLFGHSKANGDNKRAVRAKFSSRFSASNRCQNPVILHEGEERTGKLVNLFSCAGVHQNSLESEQFNPLGDKRFKENLHTSYIS